MGTGLNVNLRFLQFLNAVSWISLVVIAFCEAFLLHLEYYGIIHVFGVVGALIHAYNAANTRVMINDIKAAQEAAKYESLKKAG